MPGTLSKIVDKIKEQAPKAKKKPWELEMIIPFDKEPPREVSKEDRLTFKLRSTPTDANSTTYELKTYAFECGSCEEWLEHVKTYRKIVKGQNITNGPNCFAMIKRLLKGKALIDFERIFTEEGYSESVDNCDKVIDKLTEEIFPDRALQKQRRALRRNIRKPENMKTNQFYARLVEMNEQLEKFPNGTEDDKLSEDELKEILEFGLPKSWQIHMTLCQFKCLEKSAKEILNFCKEIEGVEKEHGSLSNRYNNGKKDTSSNPKQSSLKKRKRDSSKNSSESDKSQGGKKYCPVHGWCSHTAEDCILLKDAISNGKRKYQDKKKSGGKDKSFSKQEVSVMIASACETAVNRALSVQKQVQGYSNKKRKISFHSADGDVELNEKDVQEQVERLQIYRDKNDESSSSDSSDSS